ncbi:MAG: EAL domain-containing protein [Legionellaceae bacterium]|nr:EAL domain-containing protein [Legionellaceae bacterium]
MKSIISKNELYWEALVDALSVSVLILDASGNVLYANQAACVLLKKNHDTLIGTNFSFPVQSRTKQEIELLVSDNTLINTELSIKKGKWKQQDAYIATLYNITLRKKHEAQLKISASVFKYAKEGIVITDKENRIVDINREFCKITGYEKHEVIGKNISLLQSGKYNAAFYKQMWKDIKKHGYWFGEIWNKRKNGDLYIQLLAISKVLDESDSIINYIGTFYDISEQNKQQETLKKIAHYDLLTDLPNRTSFVEQLDQAMKYARHFQQVLTLIFIDIDDFKEVNDKLGHDVGDKLLQIFAKIVSETIRDTDTIGRYGGDEFLLLMPSTGPKEIKNNGIERLYKRLNEPVNIDNYILHIKSSMGITFYPQRKHITPEQLIRQADQAMYKSKVAGKNTTTFFDVKSEQAYKQTLSFISEMKEALTRGEIKLYFQPRVDMRINKVSGAEALMRWEHPKKGLLYPHQFLPQIKHHRFLLELTDWTIIEALKTLETWDNAGISIPLSVNIDTMQMEQPHFIQHLKKMLSPYPKHLHHLLEFEILESSVISNLKVVSKVIKQCITLGIAFALDDFGTGYSSINYLLELPFKYVKIDMQFVKNSLHNVRYAQVMGAMLDIARAVNIDVIAEGVETKKHKAHLLSLNCQYGQGFVFSKAVPSDKFLAWCKQFDDG